MPRLLTRRCPECGGEGWVPVKRCGHIGCCPCVEGIGGCGTCGGNCEVEVPCGNCGESLEVGEETECRACKEALTDGGDEMKTEDVQKTAAGLANAARKAAQALDFYLSGVVDAGTGAISLGARLPPEVVTALAAELGVKVRDCLHLRETCVIRSLVTYIGGVEVRAQGDRPATSDDYGAMPVHPPQTECLECAGPLKNVAGSDYDKGLCLACTEGRAKEAKREARRAAADLEDIHGDVLRDARKDGVSA